MANRLTNEAIILIALNLIPSCTHNQPHQIKNMYLMQRSLYTESGKWVIEHTTSVTTDKSKKTTKDFHFLNLSHIGRIIGISIAI